MTVLFDICAWFGAASLTSCAAVVLWLVVIHPAYLAVRRYRRRRAGNLPAGLRLLTRDELRRLAQVPTNYPKDND